MSDDSIKYIDGEKWESLVFNEDPSGAEEETTPRLPEDSSNPGSNKSRYVARNPQQENISDATPRKVQSIFRSKK